MHTIEVLVNVKRQVLEKIMPFVCIIEALVEHCGGGVQQAPCAIAHSTSSLSTSFCNHICSNRSGAL